MQRSSIHFSRFGVKMFFLEKSRFEKVFLRKIEVCSHVKSAWKCKIFSPGFKKKHEQINTPQTVLINNFSALWLSWFSFFSIVFLIYDLHQLCDRLVFFFYVVTWNVTTYVSYPLECKMSQEWLKWCSETNTTTTTTTTPKLNFILGWWGVCHSMTYPHPHHHPKTWLEVVNKCSAYPNRMLNRILNWHKGIGKRQRN